MPVPGRLAVGDPGLDRGERIGREAVGQYAPDLLGDDAAAGFKHVQMLEDGRKRHREGTGQLLDRDRPEAQAFDHPRRFASDSAWNTLSSLS